MSISSTVFPIGHTNSNENLLGFDHFSIVESDTVVGDKRGHARDVFDFIFLKIALIDAIETLNVRISLVLECEPVECWGADIWEAVLLGIVEGFSN
jgi:hypothetical protein